MGRRTTRRPGRQKRESGAPSATFITFLILGFIVLIWMVITMTSNPMKPPLQ